MAQQYNYTGQPPNQQGPGAAPLGWSPQGGQPAYAAGMPIYVVYPSTSASNEEDVENGDKPIFSFDNQSIRAAFVRKVFILVSIMLTVVAIMTAVPFINSDVMRFVRSSLALYWISYGTFLVVYIALMCCEGIRRSFPINLIAAGILTLSIGYMTMMICSLHNIISVLLCLIITAVCCVGIIIFSSQTKHDLTSMVGILFILSMVLLVFGIVAIISALVFKIRWLYTVYAGLAALLFMFYLAVDVQMITGGRKFELSPEEYIFASIQIFLDIIYIFWMLLSLFGSNE